MVKQINGSIDCCQFTRRFLRSALDHVWFGLFEEKPRSVNPDREKQAGGNSPRENSAPRRARILDLYLEAPEFRKAWRARRQVQPCRVICGQPILCDVL
jgi:hypothetical protein